MKIFLDTNIILDFLLKREPHYANAKKVFDMCLYKIDGFVTPHSLIDIFYILSERSDAPIEYCRNTIQKLRTVLNVIEENDFRVHSAASNYEFSDFEDAMQYESALFTDVDYIITRNSKDFEKSAIPVLSPADFLLEITNNKS